MMESAKSFGSGAKLYEADGVLRWQFGTSDRVVSGVPANPPSGFSPRKAAGQKAFLGRVEEGTSYNTSATPSGAKPLIIAESQGSPGILESVWFAFTNGSSYTAFEDSGSIRIYLDDATTPAIDVKVCDFFVHRPLAGEYATPRFGRTKRGKYNSGDFASGAYRVLWAPYQKYMRVEYVNASAATVGVWAEAQYSKTAAVLDTDQARPFISGQVVTAGSPYDKLTLIDQDGSGQIEGVWVSWVVNSLTQNPTGFNWNIQEGNLEIYVDGETVPSYVFTATEDFPFGGFGIVPLGGWPAGSVTRTTSVGSGETWPTGATASNGVWTAQPTGSQYGNWGCFYRFFPTDGIFFNSHIKAVWQLGQRSQPNMVSVTGSIDASAHISGWFNKFNSISYTTADTDATPTVQDFFNTYTPSSPPTSPWSTLNGGIPIAANGLTLKATDATATNKTVARTQASQDGWLEARVRINAHNAGNNSQALLAARATNNCDIFGSYCGVELHKVGTDTGGTVGPYRWRILARDSNNIIAVNQIDLGNDLTGVYVRLALNMKGTNVTAYWKFDDPTFGTSAEWSPLASWTTTANSNKMGLCQYNGTLECSEITFRPLKTVTQ